MINPSYFKQVGNCLILTEEEIKACVQLHKLGDSKALGKIIESHLKLAIHYAKQFEKLISDSKIFELDDLISEANFGLIEAANSFDPSKETKFGYWASFHIKKHLVNFILNHSNQIRSPQNLMKSDMRIRKKQEELLQRLQREIRADEMELFAEFNEREIDHFFHKATTQQIPEKFDLIQEDIEDNQAEVINKIKIGMRYLTTKQRQVIQMTFGIDCEQLTQSEVGKILGVTKARVGQIRKKALTKLNELMQPKK